MQAASQNYKRTMQSNFRSPLSHMRVTIGLINQQAQSSAYVPKPDNYTYYSNLKMPLNNYEVTELYATCDQDYTPVDGSIYFLPRNREDVVLNAGIVSESLLGSIEVHFPIPYDIKGLTVEFGKAFPVDFAIESDNNTVRIIGNASGHFVTEEIFTGATYLRFAPSKMVNGQSRLRIHQLTMGIGIYFDNRTILSATKKEHISPVMEELPTIDFDLTINNKDRTFDIENDESTVNFLEIGQDVVVMYGQELDDGSTEWMPGATVQLREWSADDEKMQFIASDRFDSMDGTYYRGTYSAGGISLYDLAVDVLKDAGIDRRTYWIDSYLKSVVVHNPMPVVPHKDALQLIANAGRCILYQNRDGNIFIKSSFVPNVIASSANGTYYSHVEAVLDKTKKVSYAMTGRNYTNVTPTQYFLPRQSEIYLNTGYISEAVSMADGMFVSNPVVEFVMEASYKCFGITMEFGCNCPEAMILRSFKDGVLQEELKAEALTNITVLNHEFPEMDRLVLEFTRHKIQKEIVGSYIYLTDHDGIMLVDETGAYIVISPNAENAVQRTVFDKNNSANRVVLNNVIFGSSTDYVLKYGTELTKTPKGVQLPKIRELQVIRTIYGPSTEGAKELVKETIIVSPQYNTHIFHLSNASNSFSVHITDAKQGQSATVLEHSAYSVTVEITGVSGACEVTLIGKEYIVNQSRVSRTLHPFGSLEIWENPLVSELVHAAELADWIGDYIKSDREYDLEYRGEPRIDANDIVFLENKYISDLSLRIYDHTLKFNGALSGTIKARRDMTNGKRRGS